MKRVSHWTARYLFDRFCSLAYQRLNPDEPWLTPAMVRILEDWLRPCDRGLEWGSGRSTIWFARRVGWLVSVEHDPVWHAKVRACVNGLPVDHRYCPQQVEYVGVVDGLEPEGLDFVLVDGEWRDRCALAALPYVKRGGILVVDNSNWYLPTDSRAPDSRRPHEGPASETWAVFDRAVEKWRSIHTTNGVTDTTLWVKPA